MRPSNTSKTDRGEKLKEITTKVTNEVSRKSHRSGVMEAQEKCCKQRVTTSNAITVKSIKSRERTDH